MMLAISVGVPLRIVSSSYSSLSDLAENGTGTKPNFCPLPIPQPRPLGPLEGVPQGVQQVPHHHHHNQQILRSHLRHNKGVPMDPSLDPLTPKITPAVVAPSLMLFLVIPIMFRFYFSIHIFLLFSILLLVQLYQFMHFYYVSKPSSIINFYFTLFYSSYTLFWSHTYVNF